MRAVVQRVTSARVRVGDHVTGAIDRGLVVLVGSAADDDDGDVGYVATKIAGLRVFEGEDGRPNDRSVLDIGGAVLLVSQFTLYGDVRRGRRPSFDTAAPPDLARPVYDNLVRELTAAAVAVATGEFRATM